MITLNDYLSSSGKYPDRLKSSELTEAVRSNAERLLEKVNALLADLGIDGATVSSGFRPSSVNAGIPNAAKRSLHMLGLAVDLADPDGKLDELFESNDALLKKHRLWQEHPDATNGWAHLDLKNRGPRAKNQFRP